MDKFFWSKYLGAVLIIFFATKIFALSLGDATKIYLEKSPHLEATIELHEISKSDKWRRFVINEPQFQYLNQDNSSSVVYGVSLPVSFPGKAIAYSTVDSAKVRFQKSEVIGKKFETIKYISQTYLDCALSDSIRTILRETVADLQTLSNSLNAMYESGHSTQAERIGSELQLRQIKSDLQTAEDKVRTTCEKLSKAIDVTDFGNQLNLPDDVPQSILNLLDEKSADLAHAEAALDLADASSSTAFWSQMPDINLSVNRSHYLRQSASPSGEDWTTTYGLSITIPLFFPFHEYPEYRKAKAQAAIDRNAAQVQIRELKSDQIDAAREYVRSKNRLSEIQSRDMTLAQTLVESTFSAYKAGKLGFAELMSSRKTLADLKSQIVQLKVSIINAHLRCLVKCTTTNLQ